MIGPNTKSQVRRPLLELAKHLDQYHIHRQPYPGSAIHISVLLANGYVVHGLVRRSSQTTRSRIDHITRDEATYNKSLFLHYGDLDDTTTIRRLLAKIKPDEVYHLAGQSHVGASFEIPESTCEFTAMGTLRLLDPQRL